MIFLSSEINSDRIQEAEFTTKFCQGRLLFISIYHLNQILHPTPLIYGIFSVCHNLQSCDAFKIHEQNPRYSSFQEEEHISLPLKHL